MENELSHIQEFLVTKLGFENSLLSARDIHAWNDFYRGHNFVWVKNNKDRSPDGMMKILKGDRFRWQIRVGANLKSDTSPDSNVLIVTMWDSGDGIIYDSFSNTKRDTGKPVFMAHKVHNNDTVLEQIKTHVNKFEKYALAIENECPSCGGMLVPRKAKKLRGEDPRALGKATNERSGSVKKARVYLACHDFPTCDHIASYVKTNNEELLETA